MLLLRIPAILAVHISLSRNLYQAERDRIELKTRRISSRIGLIQEFPFG